MISPKLGAWRLELSRALEIGPCVLKHHAIYLYQAPHSIDGRGQNNDLAQGRGR